MTSYSYPYRPKHLIRDGHGQIVENNNTLYSFRLAEAKRRKNPRTRAEVKAIFETQQ